MCGRLKPFSPYLLTFAQARCHTQDLTPSTESAQCRTDHFAADNRTLSFSLMRKSVAECRIKISLAFVLNNTEGSDIRRPNIVGKNNLHSKLYVRYLCN